MCMNVDSCIQTWQPLKIDGKYGRRRPRKTWDDVLEASLKTLSLMKKVTEDQRVWHIAVHHSSSVKAISPLPEKGLTCHSSVLVPHKSTYTVRELVLERASICRNQVKLGWNPVLLSCFPPLLKPSSPCPQRQWILKEVDEVLVSLN